MIALIDCNNFYCSCERAFQPALDGKPVIVLSNNDGCAVARSEEAKRLGIQMAQPIFMSEQLIREHGVRVYSSNYTLYGDMSRRVMSVIREFTPRTEVYSIDEIFADLTGIVFKRLADLGKEIRSAVATRVGIPVSVGIAPTKTLAKMANRYAKKRLPVEGVFAAETTASIEQMLDVTEVKDIWGIGSQHARFLEDHGFYTAKQLSLAPEEWVRKHMSVVGQRLLNELRGISCLPWEDAPATRKNICTSRSFGQLIAEKRILKQAVAKFTAACAEKLRKEKTCATKLEVFIQTNPHRPTDRQHFEAVTLVLDVPSNSTTELLRYAMQGLEMIFRTGHQYQKAGVVVMDLVPAAQVQLNLFQQKDVARQQRLMQSLDKVNEAFGRDVVRFGVHDYGNKWKLKRGNLSPSYTTRLKSIPKAG